MKPNEIAEYIQKAGKTQRIVEFQCPYILEFFVSLAYASKFAMNQILEVSKEISTDFRSGGRGQETERLNDEKLRNAYAEWIIKNWRGLTIKKLQTLIPGMKVEEKIDSNTDVPHSHEVAVALLENSIEFENWVISIATNLKNYTQIAEQKKKEFENLS